MEGGCGGRVRAREVLWGTFGGQLLVVQLEFGGDGDGGMWMDDVHEIVNACPEPEVLNFCIGCGHSNGRWSPMDDQDFVGNAVSVPTAYMHNALQCLGICVDSDAPEWSVKTWMAFAIFVEEGSCVRLYAESCCTRTRRPSGRAESRISLAM